MAQDVEQLRLGSLTLQVDCREPRLREVLQMILRVRLERSSLPADLALSLDFAPDRPFGDTDGLSWAEQSVTSDLIYGKILAAQGTRPRRLELSVDPDSPRLPQLDHYLLVLLNSILRRLGALKLHAAGVVWMDRTFLFLGPKGAGKTTLSLFFCQNGGLVLAEDQMLLRAGPWRLSGCDGRIRLTEKTERFFLSRQLEVEAQDYAGTSKKEVELADIGQSRPYVDYPVGRLYFPRVGERVAVTAVPRSALVRRLCQDLLPTHRFSTPAEQREFFGWITDFAAAVEPFDLELSPRLEDLPELLERL